MDALKIALETLLVGALALPWLLLGLHLFFPEAKAWRRRLPTSKDGIEYAVAAVLAVALAYTVGAAVLRLAQDFYNDDDLGLPFPPEDSIRASVYCDNPDSPWLFDTGFALSGDWANVTIKTLCELRTKGTAKERDAVRERIQQIFHLEETSLLLMGEDKTSQLRHLHQQLLVLQGVGFDGLITWVLCLLAWNAGRDSWGRWRRALPVGLFLYFLFYALLWNHLDIRELSSARHLFQRWVPDNPPFMEFSGLVLALAGYYLASRKANPAVHGSQPAHEADSDPPPGAAERQSYLSGLIVASLLTGVAYSGWFWTEILYDRMVIYSFYANHNLVKPLS